ncbi:tetratricopeptide repeat protein [Pseudomonas putida]|uniref:tetratricopeptide repeat protein n=1 Tax=Pseudomonas putida TaxID=303 RepID=UPI0012F84709|nr:hypothetical protein [Pseudomonas putida]
MIQQVQTLGERVAVLKEVTSSRLDAQDKRIGDLGISTAQQANYMGAISNLSSLVGIGITVIIAIIATIAGLAVYVSAKNRAVAEAKEAAQQWFKEHSVRHHEQIDALQSEMLALRESTTDALKSDMLELRKNNTDALHSELLVIRKYIKDTILEIDQERNKVNHHAEQTRQTFDQTVLDFLSRVNSKDQASQRLTDPTAVNAVRETSQALESKPEKEFTSGDHFARGLDEYFARRLDSALLSFEKAIKQAQTESLPPERCINLMIARAITLGELGRGEDAIAVYDEIDQRYGQDDSPALHVQVAKALLNKGVRLSLLDRRQEEIAVYDEIDQRYSDDDSPTHCARGRQGALEQRHHTGSA